MSNSVSNKKWTVMVYLAGDNNLDANGVIDLNEMKKVGSTPDMNVVTQFDRAGEGLPTKRYFLHKGTTLEKDVVESLGEINTGKPEFLVDFIKWGANNYPADHYAIILWNHGQGWDDTDIFEGERAIGNRLLRSNRIRHSFFRTSVEIAAKISAGDKILARAILIDDNAKDFLDNQEMKKALQNAKDIIGHKIDLFGMDACLMNMAEVAYQVRESVDFMVGSEETEPLDGWPYDTILEYLSSNPSVTPVDLSKTLVNKYIESYNGSGEDVTQSACDLSSLTSFAEAFKALVEALTGGLADKKTLSLISDTRGRVQEYQVNDNVDLINLCQLLRNSGVQANIGNACDEVIGAVNGKQGLVISSGYTGKSLSKSNGVAIYFPTRVLSPLYAGLDFAKETGWDKFLKDYITASRSQ